MDNLVELGVGEGPFSRKIVANLLEGGGPGLFFLGGYRSDMTGTKARAVKSFGRDKKLAVALFDYSGHGASGGQFADGTISRWLEDSLGIFQNFTDGPQIIIGSSMGSWLALLLVQRLRELGSDRAAGLVLIAPAVDMTMDLMEDTFTPAERAHLARAGYVTQPSDYGEPYRITKELIEDGRGHKLFGAPLRTRCPVHILAGAKDRDVPPAHSLKLASHLLEDPLNFTLVPDGDHSLSRPQDIELLKRVLTGMITQINAG